MYNELIWVKKRKLILLKLNKNKKADDVFEVVKIDILMHIFLLFDI